MEGPLFTMRTSSPDQSAACEWAGSTGRWSRDGRSAPAARTPSSRSRSKHWFYLVDTAEGDGGRPIDDGRLARAVGTDDNVKVWTSLELGVRELKWKIWSSTLGTKEWPQNQYKKAEQTDEHLQEVLELKPNDGTGLREATWSCAHRNSHPEFNLNLQRLIF